MSTTIAAAWQHHQAGRFADAARCYHGALAANPDDPDALHLFGVLHLQNGYHERAVELIRRAIVFRPDAAVYHINLAEAHRAQGRYAESADCCRAALSVQPDHADAANNLGLALHDLGRHAEAVEQYRAAVAVRPDFAAAHNNLGTSLRALGKVEEAVQAYREAIRLDGDFARPRANLGQVLTDRGEPAEALPHCQEAVRLDPTLPAAHNSLGNALRALKRWSEAREAYAAAVRLQPDLAVAHANLGETLRFEGRLREALPHLRLAVQLKPDDDDLCQKLVDALALAEDWTPLIPYCARRVQRSPDDAGAHCDLGWACHSDSRLVEAETAYRETLRLQPDHLGAWLNLGQLHEERGQLTEAGACYREAEARHPEATGPLARRALLERGRLSETDRDRLRFALYRPDLAPAERLSLLFSLAQVADGRGDFAEAAACLQPANALALQARRAQGILYDPDEQMRFVDNLIAAFTTEAFQRLAGSGDDTHQPVFVLGMPRSGTTLVEQVLASHPQVYAAGELGLARRAADAAPPPTGGEDIPQTRMAVLDQAGVRRMASVYCDGVRGLLARPDAAVKAAGAQRVVDKLPDNYLYLGLLALMFPRATVIHVRRDLRDVAVSCWMTHFRSIPWADDLDHLARRCRDYRRLMEHWRRVLPRPIHEVQYERLVDDFEPTARGLFAACGLEWDSACMHFHRTQRPVRTASATQVRQPLYRKSVARWKAYEPYLGPFFARLPEADPGADEAKSHQ